jgi:hypothetical protein
MKRTHCNEKRAPKAPASLSVFGLLSVYFVSFTVRLSFSVPSPRTSRSRGLTEASVGRGRTQGAVVSASTLRARFPPTLPRDMISCLLWTYECSLIIVDLFMLS